MTNYNERLDEILIYVINEGWFLRSKTDYPNGFTNADVRNIQEKAKQAITSLNKELVAEAKPMVTSVNVIETYLQNGMTQKAAEHDSRNHAISQFEQNLLKALEEV